jgi:hypothetical protein
MTLLNRLCILSLPSMWMLQKQNNLKKVNSISPPKMLLRDLILFINFHKNKLVVNSMKANIVDVDVAMTTLFLLEFDTSVEKIYVK